MLSLRAEHRLLFGQIRVRIESLAFLPNGARILARHLAQHYLKRAGLVRALQEQCETFRVPADDHLIVDGQNVVAHIQS